MIEINLSVAKDLVRMLDRMQEVVCTGCRGDQHEDDCPAHGSVQLRNYLTQRVNNPNRNFKV